MARRDAGYEHWTESTSQENDERQERMQRQAEEVLEKLGKQFGNSATVNGVFGEPQTIGERTVIPVARVWYGYGGGGGGGQSGAQARNRAKQPDSATDSGPDQRDSGGGFGGAGGLRVEPLAVVEIRRKGVRIIPIVDVNRLVGRVFATVFGFTFAGLVLKVLSERRTQREVLHLPRFARLRRERAGFRVLRSIPVVIMALAAMRRGR